MIRWAALVAALLPSMAGALSCLPYTAADAYTRAAQAEEEYRVVLGMLDFDPSALPQSNHGGGQIDPATAELPATVSGVALSASQFETPFRDDIRLVVECIASWCPVLAPRGVHLMFLEIEGSGHVLRANPCRNDAFADPSDSDLGGVLDCHAGRSCPSTAD